MKNETVVDIKTLEQMYQINLANRFIGEPVQPVVLAGAPGSGKTQILKNVLPEWIANAYGCSPDDVEVLVLPLTGRDAAEVLGFGIPTEINDEFYTQFSKSPFVLALLRAKERGAKYIVILIDELMQADVNVVNVVSHMLDADTSTIGGEPLGENVIVCATGNRVVDRAASKPLPAQIIDRVILATMNNTTQDCWVPWAYANNINPLVITCAQAYEGRTVGESRGLFADKVPKGSENYCTKRSLTRVSKQLDSFFYLNGDNAPLNDGMKAIITGNIGNDAGNVLIDWIRDAANATSIADIQADPDHAMIPESLEWQSISAGNAFRSAIDGETAGRAITYAMRLTAKDVRIDICSRIISKAGKNKWDFNSNAAQKFMVEYPELHALFVKHLEA